MDVLIDRFRWMAACMVACAVVVTALAANAERCALGGQPADGPAHGARLRDMPSGGETGPAAAAGTPQPGRAKQPGPATRSARGTSAGNKKAPPPSPYKVAFFDNDFSYLEDAQPDTFYPGDGLKRIRFGDAILDIGGEFRLRYHHEHNLRGSDLSGRDDNFLLQQTRLYGDLRNEWLRAYVELIDAMSSFEKFAPRTIEENRFDALNLFSDVLLLDADQGRLWARAGRQEQIYGAERLVSPLNWGNTRRTFDGAKVFWRGEDWNLDGFWLRPVPFGQHVSNDHNFDHPDQSQEFLGLYATSKAIEGQPLDLYYLRLAEYDAPGTPANPADFDANTFGVRKQGKVSSWLWEFEGGYQFGTFGPLDQSAGFCVVGAGYEWAEGPFKPSIWTYYDWASGNRDPADARHSTFNQLFPLAHKYLGFMDLVARQNIHDVNFLGTLSPTARGKVLLWWHIFHLDEPRDSLYNALGVPIRTDRTGAAGSDVGQELDLLYQHQLDARTDVLLGYSHFFAGDFVVNAPDHPAGESGDADFVYTQFSRKF